MLAENWEDYENFVQLPVYAQPKLDGVRCIATKDGLKSRTGKEIVAVPHIFESLKPFFAENPNVVLDGELYCDKFDNDFNAICSIVRKSKVTAEDARNAEVIEYHVYDLVDESMRFSERTDFIEENFLWGATRDYIIPVRTCLVETKTQLDGLYSQWKEQGYEGQMIRLNGPYEKKRSKSLLKRKEFKDSEYPILGWKEGKNKRAGTIGHLCFETKDGVKFNSNVRGDVSYLEEVLEQGDSLIGKTATIKYFHLTPAGVPRFPYVIAIRDVAGVW